MEDKPKLKSIASESLRGKTRRLPTEAKSDLKSFASENLRGKARRLPTEAKSDLKSLASESLRGKAQRPANGGQTQNQNLLQVKIYEEKPGGYQRRLNQI